MAYDPYAPNEDMITAGSILKDIATAPFQPSTYIWTHMHMPSMWDTKKGIATPFGAKQIDAIGQIGGTFKKSGFKAGTKAIWSQKGTLNPWSMFTTMLGKDRQYAGTRIIGSISKNETRLARLTKLSAGYEIRREAYRSLYDDFLKEAFTYADKFDPPLLGARVDRGLTDSSIFYKQGLEKYSKRATRTGEKILGAKTDLFWGKTARWGVRAGKAASIVGLGMLAWDITQMIGRPLGAAAVNLVDQGLTKWSNRFMPEVGGQLAMSYLSQGAATERQRAVEAMGRSQINGRSAFGQEASFVHR